MPRRVVAREPRHALRRLQRDIAGEAVGDHHVDCALGDVVALDEAAVVQRQAGAAPSSRCASRTSSCPFTSSEPTLRMPTVGRQGSAAPGSPWTAQWKASPRMANCDQHRGVAVDVGAHVQHGGDAAQGRPARDDGGAVQRAHGAQLQLADGHQGAGVAAADRRLRLARLHRRHGVPEAGALAAPAAPGRASRRRRSPSRPCAPRTRERPGCAAPARCGWRASSPWSRKRTGRPRRRRTASATPATNTGGPWSPPMASTEIARGAPEGAAGVSVTERETRQAGESPRRATLAAEAGWRKAAGRGPTRPASAST